MNKEDFFAQAATFKTQPVKLSDKTLHLRDMNAQDAVIMQSMVQEIGKEKDAAKQQAQVVAIMDFLLIFTLCDDAGELMFSEVDFAQSTGLRNKLHAFFSKQTPEDRKTLITTAALMPGNAPVVGWLVAQTQETDKAKPKKQQAASDPKS